MYFLDYGTKAENAIDYEDIEEQYEGPEVQSVPEESSILADDYLARNISMSSIIHKQPLFDEENYDEDDDGEKENESAEAKLEAQAFLPTGYFLQFLYQFLFRILLSFCIYVFSYLFCHTKIKKLAT